MTPSADPAARRPLKSRSTRWAQSLARTLLRLGVKPNQVSVASVVFAAGAGAAMIWGGGAWWAWLLAALGIQLRLLCNLMDGMLAVEGGLKSPSGDLYNEFPDRLADMFILAALGWAGGTWFGWAAACGALMTAAVRLQGASLTGRHDFRGPMAKPHRMALATGVSLLLAVGVTPRLIPWALGLMLVGLVITLWRRLTTLSQNLHTAARP